MPGSPSRGGERAGDADARRVACPDDVELVLNPTDADLRSIAPSRSRPVTSVRQLSGRHDISPTTPGALRSAADGFGLAFDSTPSNNRGPPFSFGLGEQRPGPPRGSARSRRSRRATAPTGPSCEAARGSLGQRWRPSHRNFSSDDVSLSLLSDAGGGAVISSGRSVVPDDRYRSSALSYSRCWRYTDASADRIRALPGRSRAASVRTAIARARVVRTHRLFGRPHD